MNLKMLMGNANSSVDPEEVDDYLDDDEDYLDDLLPEDPKPAWVEKTTEEKPKTSRTTPAAKPVNTKPKKFTKAQSEDLKQQLIFMVTVPNMAFAMRDPVCSSVIDENLENIIDKLLPIINKNATLYKLFMNADKATNFLDYVNLCIAMTPVIAAIKAHHMGKSDHNEEEVTDENIETFFSPV